MTHQAITCTECGQLVHVREGVAYVVVDSQYFVRHHCATNTVPAHVIPEWVRESVEYGAFEKAGKDLGAAFVSAYQANGQAR